MRQDDFAQFVAMLQSEAEQARADVHPNAVADYAVELTEIARRIERRAVRQCNEEISERGQKRMDNADERDYARAEEIAERLGLNGIKRQSDARGYGLKLLLPSGRYNSMGGPEEGWGVPS